MTVNSTSVLGANSATTTPSTKKSNGTTESPQEIQDRFMSLLVAQLKNQDPLQPMDNAAVTSQMAQLNTVTGINNLNTTMQNMASSFAASQTVNATSLLGRTIMVNGNDLTLGGGKPADGALDVQQATDAVSVAVLNGAGKTVRTIDMGALAQGTHQFSWDGKDDTGSTLPDGRYTFAVSATAAGQKAAVGTLDITSVVGLQNDPATGSKLLTAAGTQVAVSDIKQIF